MIIDPSVIRQVSREKDIDPEKMFAALEEAMSSAARKFYHDKAVVTAIDRKTGEMAVTSRRTVVEELDTESEEPPPQILLSEAQEMLALKGAKGNVRVLRPAGEGEPPWRSRTLPSATKSCKTGSPSAWAASPPRPP
ncbi:MAG TPA: NusA N-terminal domain-containing protein, partial [Thermoanaerobaculia bacterium]|nr:NusA N-terminal domain-containing protein [Thermoanaerobaculia bacterium]